MDFASDNTSGASGPVMAALMAAGYAQQMGAQGKDKG